MKLVTRTLILAASLASVQLASSPALAQIAQLPPDRSVFTLTPDDAPAGIRCALETEVPGVAGAAVAARPPVSTSTGPLCAAPSDPGAIGWSMPPVGDVTDQLGQVLQRIRSVIEPQWSLWLLSLSDRLGSDLGGGMTDVA